MVLAYKEDVKAGSPKELIIAVQDALSVQETGIYGPTTQECVEKFQEYSKLPVTGIVDKKTWEALFPQRTLRQAILKLAGEQVGVKEQPIGSNTGPMVNKYLASAALPPGVPWCLAFVYWVVSNSCNDLKKRITIPQSGYCPFLLSWATRNKRLTSTPQPGDIFLLKHAKWGASHTGFVEKVVGTIVYTIEGNANQQHSTNGDGVYRLQRPFHTMVYVTAE